MKIVVIHLDPFGRMRRRAMYNRTPTKRLLGILRSTENTVYADEIKAVLATREHVPNKVEAKQTRKQSAEKNRGNGKGKNR